jgi:hypothetical protein
LDVIFTLVGNKFPGWISLLRKQEIRSWCTRREVEKSYRQFPAGTIIGMEATGNSQWFLELMATCPLGSVFFKE